MEKAFLAEGIAQLGMVPGDCTRLYFGSETCEERIPSVSELGKARAFCRQKGLGFSLATPFCTDSGLKRLLALFRLLSGEDEVVANDLGVLTELQKFSPKPVAGRLLNRQFGDPRIASLGKGFSSEAVEHFSLSQASVPKFRELLFSLGVERFELDNLLQGIGTDLGGERARASLHFPFVLVSSTRLCLSAGSGRLSESGKVGILGCGRECGNFAFSLESSSVPGKLFVFGNSLFFENRALPGESWLEKRNIDRLVLNQALGPEQD